MTSRERVIRALRHEPVDRMPVDLGVHPSTGISAFAYWNLRKHLGLSTDSIRIPDMVQGLAYVDADMLERFHCDCMMLEPPFRRTLRWSPREGYEFSIPADSRPQQAEDGSWIISKGDESMRMPPGGFFFDGAWLSDWGEGDEDDRLALYAREAERIFKETPYATIFLGYGHRCNFPAFGGGSIRDALRAFDDPDGLRADRQARLNANLQRMDKVIRMFGRYIQMVALNDDMGGQNGPVCSPDYIEQFCFPYYKAFCDFVHANSDIKVFLHCCGSIRALMPMLIEAGIDAINPVQIAARDMDPQTLKEEFGERICFWGGGCDTQRVLPHGTPDEVREHVRRQTRVFGRNSGYVFCQVHNIMGDVPPENVVAMLEAAHEESHPAAASSSAG